MEVSPSMKYDNRLISFFYSTVKVKHWGRGMGFVSREAVNPFVLAFLLRSKVLPGLPCSRLGVTAKVHWTF